jgi:hypothetical protein
VICVFLRTVLPVLMWHCDRMRVDAQQLVVTSFDAFETLLDIAQSFVRWFVATRQAQSRCAIALPCFDMSPRVIGMRVAYASVETPANAREPGWVLTDLHGRAWVRLPCDAVTLVLLIVRVSTTIEMHAVPAYVRVRAHSVACRPRARARAAAAHSDARWRADASVSVSVRASLHILIITVSAWHRARSWLARRYRAPRVRCRSCSHDGRRL